MWLARDEDGALQMFVTDEAPVLGVYERIKVWISADDGCDGIPLVDRNKYPWVTFQNSPVKIKIVPEC